MNTKKLALVATTALSIPLIATPAASAFPIESYVGCLIPNIYCDYGDSTVFESEPAPAINMVPQPSSWAQNDSGVYEYQAPDYSDPNSYDVYYYDYQEGQYVDAPSDSGMVSDPGYSVNY